MGQMLNDFAEAVRIMQRSAPHVHIRINLDKKSFDHLAFEMMKDDRAVSDPKGEAARFGGHLNIMGAVIVKDFR